MVPQFARDPALLKTDRVNPIRVKLRSSFFFLASYEPAASYPFLSPSLSLSRSLSFSPLFSLFLSRSAGVSARDFVRASRCLSETRRSRKTRITGTRGRFEREDRYTAINPFVLKTFQHSRRDKPREDREETSMEARVRRATRDVDRENPETGSININAGIVSVFREGR